MIRTARRLGATALVVLFGTTAMVRADDSTGGGEAATPASPVSSDEEIARVLALPEDTAWGEYLAGECAACHGTASGDGSVPVVHGADAAYIVDALLQYRSGARPNTTMRDVAGALGDEEIAVLARHLAGAELP